MLPIKTINEAVDLGGNFMNDNFEDYTSIGLQIFC